MDLHGRYFQCFQLRCILFANLAYAAKSHDQDDEARAYKQNFLDEVGLLKIAVDTRKKSLQETIQKLQYDRLYKVETIESPHFSDPNTLSWWMFNFRDSYSARKWEKKISTNEKNFWNPWGDKGTSWENAQREAHELLDPLRRRYIQRLLEHTWKRMENMNKLLQSFDKVIEDTRALLSVAGKEVVDEKHRALL